MTATVRNWRRRGKATTDVRCPYQRGRQEAFGSHYRQVAETLGLSRWTLAHELSDPNRDPVRRVAERLRAFLSRGGSTEAAHLYVAEILDVLGAGVMADGRPLAELHRAEQFADGDEDATQMAWLLTDNDPVARRNFVQYATRYIATLRALIARAEAAS